MINDTTTTAKMVNNKNQLQANKMAPQERIAKITRRLDQETLKPKMRAKLAVRLAMLQKKVGVNPNPTGDVEKPAFPQLTKRLAMVTAKLETEQDEAKRADLEKRKSNLAAKLAQKQKNQENKQQNKQQNKPNRKMPMVFPGLKKRLANIEAKLKTVTDETKRANLEKRKANVEAQLAQRQAKQQQQENTSASVSRGAGAVCTMEVEEPKTEEPKTEGATKNSKPEFPVLTKRLAQIESKLKNTKNDMQRANLEQRKANLEAKIAQKRQQKNQKSTKTGPFPGLKSKLAKLQLQLKNNQNDETKCVELEKRKALLLLKIAEKQEMKDACPGGNLSRQVERTQALLAEAEDPERRHSLQERLSHFQQRQEEASESSASSGQEAPQDPRRERQKQKLIQMEKNARNNKNEQALDRIALQQVYVGHFPEAAVNYVPVFGKEHDLCVKRASLRGQALELARTEQSTVDWIAPDMYERLPRSWTMDDEIAMFGQGNSNTNQQKKKGKGNCCGKNKNNNQKGNECETEAMEEGFEKVAAVEIHSGDEGWMEVDDENEEAPAKNNNNKKNKGKNQRNNKNKQGSN